MKLRELICKGPKYRELNKINWKATENMLFGFTDHHAEWWDEREQMNLKYLYEWKELVVDRISVLKGKFKSPKCKVLKEAEK